MDLRTEQARLLASYSAGDLGQAEALARVLTARFPDDDFGWKVLGAVLNLTGRLEESLEPMRQAVRLRPDDAEALNNLGISLINLNQPVEGARACRQAVRLRPDYAQAHANLGRALKDLGRADAAEASYASALRFDRELVEAHVGLGDVLRALGRPAEAAAACREAIRLRPDDAQAHGNLGNALRDLDRPVEAEASYRRAIQLKPDLAEVHGNLGVVLSDLGRLTEAEASYREAIRLRPDYAEAHSNLGHLLKDLGRLAEAEASCREAIRIDPDYAEAWSNLLFCLNYVASLPPAAALAEAERYGAAVSARATPKFTAWRGDPAPERLRVGFVSGDLRNHPVGYFVEGLVEHLDRSRFELVAFPTTPRTDDLTDRIKPGFGDWIPLFGQTDPEAAALIRQQGIDVLLDLSGHTAHNRLPVFAFRPAPVQASWLGYFATTGLPEMDYFLGDAHMLPEGDAGDFTERPWALPETWLCLAPPTRPVAIEGPPASANGVVTFGCFGNLSKMNDAVVELWATTLRRVPDAKLFLKSRPLADDRVVADVRGRFAARGVTEDRLILEGASSRTAYLEAYNRVDLVLDTFPYPGGTTSVDALWMGVPVLTLAGDRFLSRLGESIARNAGQADWIAQSRDDYVAKAVAFAADPCAGDRAALRDRVLRTPLFDTERFARHFGDALWGMWRAGPKA